jgi:hypothetical protein
MLMLFACLPVPRTIQHVYLGLFDAEKEAAQAYDRALVRLKGKSAATNEMLSNYTTELEEYHEWQRVSVGVGGVSGAEAAGGLMLPHLTSYSLLPLSGEEAGPGC